MTSSSRTSPPSTDVEALVREHLQLVHYVAREIGARLPGHIDIDDLVSAGNTGLVQAAQSYDPSSGVPFNRWANQRIRGAILDDLRAMDWASRRVRSRQRSIRETEDQLTAELGRYPSAVEVARSLGTEVHKVNAAKAAAERTVLSLDVPEYGLNETVPDHAATPADQAEIAEQWKSINAAMMALPERLRVVILGVYVDQRPQAELAEELGVSESRISQLRAEGIRHMRHLIDSGAADAAARIPVQRAESSDAHTVKVGKRRFFTGK